MALINIGYLRQITFVNSSFIYGKTLFYKIEK